MTFRLGDFFIYGHNIQFYHRRNCQTADDTADIPHTAMMVMMVCMHMFRLFFSMNGYPDMCSVDTAFCASLCSYRNTWDSQSIHFFQKAFPVRKKFQQGCRQHISGSTHATVNIKCSHFLTSIWLIILARYPAPKPLSMFTTDTPLAQELSMLSSADTPPKEAP